VQLIGSEGHNADLASGAFPILSAIAVREDVIFPHRFDPEQHPAGPGRRNEQAGRVGANVVDPLIRNRLVSGRLPATEKAVQALLLSIFEVLLDMPTLSVRS